VVPPCFSRGIVPQTLESVNGLTRRGLLMPPTCEHSRPRGYQATFGNLCCEELSATAPHLYQRRSCLLLPVTADIAVHNGCNKQYE
jgi:hypothetical protein